MSPELSLYQLNPLHLRGDWRESLEKRADDAAVEYDIIGTRLRLWDPKSPIKKTPRADIGYRDGIRLQRVNLGDHRDPPAIGLSMCRLYFPANSHLPSLESHFELFSAGSTPDVLRHIPALPAARRLLEAFNHPDPILKPMENIDVTSLAPDVHFQFGSGRPESLDRLLTPSFSKRILSSIRDCPAAKQSSINLAFIPSFSNHQDQAKRIASATAEVLESEWGCRLKKSLISDHDDLTRWSDKTKEMVRCVLIALDTTKGERPPKEVMEWLSVLSEQGIPFQLCSSTSNPTYVRHGIACVILAKAGGLLYTTSARSIPDLADHWCIGLDLGFGGQYEGKIVVITLTDGHGHLKAYWRALKDSDETLREDVLKDGLEWIVSKAEAIASGRKYLVLRDGIRPKHEELDFYRRILPADRSTLVEYSKSGNPLLLAGDSPPPPGTLCIPPDSQTAFLYPATSPQNGVLTNTVKFFSPLNGLNYTLEQLGEAITALCHASKLSFQPSSLPAPIYWADGLAGLSASNLQFGGWSHLPNRTRDLRPTADN